MATRFIQQDLGVQAVGKSVAGFGVDTNGNLAIARGSDFKGALSADPGAELIAIRRVILPSGATTLTKADSGALVSITRQTTFTLTLPSVSTGLEYDIYCAGVATAGIGYTIAPASGEAFLFQEATASSSLYFVQATQATGDCVKLVGTGSGWAVIAQCNATTVSAGLNLV